MSQTIKYKQFIGNIEVCLETSTVHGKILYISDLVTYSADSLGEIRKEFEMACEDYLSLCEEVGKDPCKPFKGSFQVRVGEVMHKKIAYSASEEGINLNEWIKQACESKFCGGVHNHSHVTVNVKQHGEEKDIKPVVFGKPEVSNWVEH